MTNNMPPAVAIMGPTGTGKTDLAVQLVERYPFEIISVDSALVYRGMDIGTAKPDKLTLAKAPHRLIDIIEPTEVYSAASFRRDAINEMRRIRKSGKIPLLVGGTGLYFRALLDGISELPPADPEVRMALEAEAEEKGWQQMHQRLSEVDPESAARIHPNDPQRIERALEVFQITGRPISSFFSEKPNPLSDKVIKVILEPEDRAWLHARLAQRFDIMLEQGVIDEVKTLLKKYEIDAESPSMRLVGYRQILQFLQGELEEKDMVERAVIATRQLAKRQLTWFRSVEKARRIFIDTSSPLDEISKFINL